MAEEIRENEDMEGIGAEDTEEEDFDEAPTTVQESPEEIRVSVEVPGVTQDDIQLEVTEDELRIRVEHEERRLQSIVPLPEDADTDNIQAELIGDMIELRIPRTA